MRILLTGDSLALPRPHRIKNFDPLNEDEKELAVHYDETYGYLLQTKLRELYPLKEIDVINRCQRFFTIKNVCSQFADHLYFFEPDIIIMQVGIVDCWFRSELKGKQLVNLNDFKQYLQLIVQHMKNRANTKLIIIGIAPTSLKMENRYPRINDEINRYNDALKEIRDFQQIFYIDTEKYININSIREYLLPDDHHLNKKGNELVFIQLNNIIQAFIENEEGCFLHQKNEITEAYAKFQNSYRIFPDYVDNLYNMLFLSAQLKQQGEIDTILQTIKKLDFKNDMLENLVNYLENS